MTIAELIIPIVQEFIDFNFDSLVILKSVVIIRLKNFKDFSLHFMPFLLN